MTENQSWSLVDSGVLAGTVPWRTFRWYHGQRHYSGSYWSATMRDHVIYESRLELSRLPGGGVRTGAGSGPGWR